MAVSIQRSQSGEEFDEPIRETEITFKLKQITEEPESDSQDGQEKTDMSFTGRVKEMQTVQKRNSLGPVTPDTNGMHGAFTKSSEKKIAKLFKSSSS